MKIAQRLLQLVTVITFVGALFAATPSVHAITPGTITVNTTANTLSDGLCSLQEAVNLVNGVSGSDACARSGSTSIDTIVFSIGSGAQTITLSSVLEIQNPVLLDGSSQPGYSGAPLIRVTGSFGGLLQFDVGSENSIVKALELTDTYSGAGLGFDVKLLTGNITIVGNYFSTDGSAVVGNNSIGVLLNGSSTDMIGGGTAAARNLFGSDVGVRIDDGSSNTIQGNYFGVTPGGSTALTGLPANDSAIIACEFGCGSASLYNVIRGNVITGYYEGVSLDYPASSNTIVGNIIGLGADGATPLGTMDKGVALRGSSSNTIGGTTSTDRNVIAGNNYNIQLYNLSLSELSSGNTIQGNYIGTAANGLSRITPYGTLFPDFTGIDLLGGNANLIGGTAPGAGNLISGNTTAIHIASAATATIIRGNLIGTDVTGTVALPQYSGIFLDTGASADIGDAVTPGSNLISGNTNQGGIIVTSSTGTTIFGNRLGVAISGDNPIPNVRGISLIGASATISGNWIAHSTLAGINLDASSTTLTNSKNNCITGNAAGVISLNSGATASLQSNWWGRRTGPTHSGNPGGTGDSSSDYVDYSSFLTAAPTACSHVFADVPVSGKEWMEPWINAFYWAHITTGCGVGPLVYCPGNYVTRAEMAVFLLRAIHGPGYTPPNVTGIFADMPVTGKEWMEPWVDEFYNEGLTTGCATSPLRYCPEDYVTRQVMAIFILRALHGGSYTPPVTSGIFADMPVTGLEWMESWVDEFYNEGITTGCATSPLRYCPTNNVTRAEMAVFIDRAFSLYP